MSIYSGFPTRKDESKYNDLLSKLILMMQQHLLETVQGEIAQKKVLGYTKVISKMKEYEEHKYLPPKFTQLLEPLCKLIGISCCSDRVSQETTQIEQKLKYMSQKSKSLAQSANKERVKSKLATCLQNLETKHTKKSSLLQEVHLKSTSHLKQRKININIQSAQGVSTQLGTYDIQEALNANTVKNFMGSQPVIASNKIKSNLRYRAFQALSEAQQNIHKRNTPLRQQMRKKLKTHTQEHSVDQL